MNRNVTRTVSMIVLAICIPVVNVAGATVLSHDVRLGLTVALGFSALYILGLYVCSELIGSVHLGFSDGPIRQRLLAEIGDGLLSFWHPIRSGRVLYKAVETAQHEAAEATRLELRRERYITSVGHRYDEFRERCSKTGMFELFQEARVQMGPVLLEIMNPNLTMTLEERAAAADRLDRMLTEREREFNSVVSLLVAQLGQPFTRAIAFQPQILEVLERIKTGAPHEAVEETINATWRARSSSESAPPSSEDQPQTDAVAVPK